MKYNQETLDYYKKFLSIDLQDFYTRFANFISNDNSTIINFYTGKIKKISGDVIDRLKILSDESEKNLAIIYLHKGNLKTTEDWFILDDLEEIKMKLKTISNSYKFLRSTIEKGIYDYDMISEQTLNYGETLVKKFGEQNWVEVALYNDLEEENYNTEGGITLKTKINRKTNNFKVNSVVDSQVGQKLYGIDIYQKLTFEDDDIKVLSYKDTVKQAINILINLKKNDNPEFPNDGVDSNIIGSNRNSFQFPVIFRQLINSFMKDDTLSGFAVTDIRVEKDGAFVDFKINTRYNEILTETLKL